MLTRWTFTFLKLTFFKGRYEIDMKFYSYLHLHMKIMPKVSHYKTLYFLRYTHPRYMKCLLRNMQKEYNMLKSSLLFKRNTDLQGK